MHCSLSPKNHAWQNCFSCSSHYKFNEFKFISSVLLFYLFHTGSTSLKRQIYFTVSNDSLFCAPQVYQRGQRSQDSPNLPWRGMLSPWHAPPQGASQPPTSGGFEMTRRSKVSTPSGLIWSGLGHTALSLPLTNGVSWHHHCQVIQSNGSKLVHVHIKALSPPAGLRPQHDSSGSQPMFLLLLEAIQMSVGWTTAIHVPLPDQDVWQCLPLLLTI